MTPRSKRITIRDHHAHFAHRYQEGRKVANTQKLSAFRETHTHAQAVTMFATPT